MAPICFCSLFVPLLLLAIQGPCCRDERWCATVLPALATCLRPCMRWWAIPGCGLGVQGRVWGIWEIAWLKPCQPVTGGQLKNVNSTRAGMMLAPAGCGGGVATHKPYLNRNEAVVHVLLSCHS